MPKALYRIPTTSDLIRALQATKNLRRIAEAVGIIEITTAGHITTTGAISAILTEKEMLKLQRENIGAAFVKTLQMEDLWR